MLSIGLPPKGEFHIDVNPNSLIFANQSLRGTLVSPLCDIDETLDFAKRGTQLSLTLDIKIRVFIEANDLVVGKLHLEPTVVGVSKWNESVQKLRNGQVAGSVLYPPQLLRLILPSC